MKKDVVLLWLFVLAGFAYADISSRLNITEQDGSPSTYPYKAKFSNGTVTDNGDGTVSISNSGGGSSASTLAVGTGTASGFSTPSSSPTAVINFNSARFNAILTGVATAYVDLTSSQTFSDVTAATMTVQNSVFANDYALGNTSGTPKIIYVGDSLTSGSGGAGPYSDFITTPTFRGVYFSSTNVGAGGLQLSVMYQRAYSVQNPYFARNAGMNIAVVWGGTNDFVLGASTATVYSYLYQFGRHLRQLGWKVIVLTMLPRNDLNNVYMTDYDALIRANWPEFADSLADVQANVNLQNPVDGFYFLGDGVHLTNNGYLIVAGIVQTSISNVTRATEDNFTNVVAIGTMTVSSNTFVAGSTFTFKNNGLLSTSQINWLDGSNQTTAYRVSPGTMTWQNNFGVTFSTITASSNTFINGGLNISSTVFLSGDSGTAGKVLISGGAGGVPGWTTISGGVNAAPIVQSVTDLSFGTFSSGVPQGLTPGLVMLKGQLLVLMFGGNGGTAHPTAIIDSMGNTWTHVPNSLATSGVQQCDMWYAQGVAAGSTTITMTVSAAANAEIHVYIVSGASTGDALLTGSGTTASTTGAPLGPSLTPTALGQLMIVQAMNVSGSNLTSVNSPWVAGQKYVAMTGGFTAYYSSSTTTAQQAVFNPTGSQTYMADGAIFQATSSVSSGTLISAGNNIAITQSGPYITITSSQTTGPIVTSTVTVSGVLFATLGTSAANGVLQYCSDCTVTTAATCTTNLLASCVCAGSGSGAFAKRLNGTWYCE